MGLIIGIDLAYAHPIGFCQMQINGRHDTSALKPPRKSDTIWTRQANVLQTVMATIGSGDLVLIEGYAFSARSSSDAPLKELGGLVRHAVLERTGTYPIVVAPALLKKFATGKGNCKKDLILLEVFARWGERFTDDNAADAYVLARIGLALVTKPTLPKFQQECVKKLLDSLHVSQLARVAARGLDR